MADVAAPLTAPPVRPALLAVLLTAAASAQPVALPLPPARLAVVVLNGVPREDAGSGLRFVVGTSMAVGGSIVGAGLGALTVLALALDASDRALVVGFTAGGVVGSALAVAVATEALGLPTLWPAPSAAFRRDDWLRALAGAAAGSVPGLLIATGLQGEDPGWWLAVPIAQALGAGLAIAL